MIGTPKMDWRESWSLTRTLIADGSSQLGAAVNGWVRPWPAEAWVMADLWKLIHHAHFKPPHEYPLRPNAPKPTRLGRATRPQRVIRAELARRAPRK